MKNHVAIIVAASALLAGCSSSSDDTTQNYNSFAEIEVDAVAMRSAYVDPDGTPNTGVTPASAAAIPDFGSATYLGFVTGNLGGSDLIGELTVDVLFQPNTISNTATNFYHETAGAYTGTLTGSGVLTQDPPLGVSQISTSLDGTLTNGGTNYPTSLALEGDIFANGGDPYGAVAGFVDGTVGVGVFTGAFVAER